MVLKYQMSAHDLANQGNSESNQKAKKVTVKRVVLICILFLVNAVVIYSGYSLWAAERGTPVLEALKVNAICDLWTKRMNAAKKRSIAKRRDVVTKPGTVTAILYSNEDPCALINHNLVHEGDITNGVKVVKIYKCEVEFEKNGKRWTQKVLANPSPAWKAAEQPTG